ncbi:MFS transporter [Paenibacillus agricola]|uniref:MFS transporter n=1 Tax=Paenibacillus agricola TaxID=2716264 RepID=A0ABX0J459_9BACL|nr:MFS transporter [Paenibacillus agricola]NHN28794.1 MFS transporter [Paenibacillus agricola]
MKTKHSEEANEAAVKKNATVFSILFAVSMVHLLNDTIQSIVPAIFPRQVVYECKKATQKEQIRYA